MYELFDINNLIVVKHNRVIDAEYSMGVCEQRILLTCIAKIDSTKGMDENRIFNVSIDDILDLVNVERSSAYPHLKRTCKTLFTNTIVVHLPDSPDPLVTRWVDAVRYVEREGRVELRFTPEMIPFLTEISRDFTKYKLSDVLKFKSAYSYRLYELICRWGNMEHTFAIEWIREKFQLLDKYEKIADFKRDVIDIAVKEINEFSSMNISYEQIKKGRNIIALRFIYAKKQDRKNSKVESEPTSNPKPIPIQISQSEMAGGIDIDIIQFNDKEKVMAKNALAKVPEQATQRIILALLKSALSKGNVKAPMRYLNGLINKSLSGDLDITSFTVDTAPKNDFERQEQRVKRIRGVFDIHGEQIKAELLQNGYVLIKGEGLVYKSEFETLGLIAKAPHISNGKLQSLSEILGSSEKKILAKEEPKALQKSLEVQQPKEFADIKLGVRSEKEIAARQKILELEAQLIAAGEFTGANAMTISEEELTGLAAMAALEAHLLKRNGI